MPTSGNARCCLRRFAPRSEHEHNNCQKCRHRAHSSERCKWPFVQVHPPIEPDKRDNERSNGGTGADEGKANHQPGLFNLLGYLAGGPCPEFFDLRAYLGEFMLDVHSQQAQYQLQHQPRPRTISPIAIPTASAPARAPSGFLRAIPSSSVAKVLSCSVADEAISALVVATPLA